MFKSEANPMFRSAWAEENFRRKYMHEGCETWENLARVLANDVCKGILPQSEIDYIYEIIRDMKFIPGGRYLYYAGRKAKFYNNCYLLKAEEDTREDWANLSWKAESCLMTGGGIGVDYSVYREEGRVLGRTGGLASGPIPKMRMTNEIGRFVMQGGSRRSALWATLSHEHPDVMKFIFSKDWHNMPVGNTGKTLWDIRQDDYNFPAPLDMTNISVSYGDSWLTAYQLSGNPGELFRANMLQACKTGEPGFSFNFGDKADETLRNACCEITSADDSDCCNLGSINLSRIELVEEFQEIVKVAVKFLMCGSLRSHVPYEKVAKVKEKNRRIGLGLMGIHEWLLARGYNYSVGPHLRQWLEVYRDASNKEAVATANALGMAIPAGVRAIAPTGTIGIIAGTTTGIEPLFGVAYKRRVLTRGTEWIEEYVIDDAAATLIERGHNPDKIETALDLAKDPERRISFQYDVQKYVDHAISSTINLPTWGSEYNNPDTVERMSDILAAYADGLRGFTCYPDAARGGQPLTVIPYEDAVAHFAELEAHDICEIGGKGGVCGV